jgi:glycosyltransferase involved in cell wall biosynthesis
MRGGFFRDERFSYRSAAHFVKISIITVCYNSAATITDALASVSEQLYEDIEHIVVDGGSSDSTVDLVKRYGKRVSKLAIGLDNGIYDAMNKGVLLATGDVIGILNSDDFYVHSSVLNEVASAFSSDPSLDVAMGDVDFVANSNLVKPLRTYRALGFQPWMFQIGLMPPHPAIFIRKSAYGRVGLYKLDYKIAADFDFLVRLLLTDGAKFCITGKHWVRMCTGGVSTSGWRSKYVITQEMLRSLRENKIFSCIPMLLLRVPIKFFRQVL